MEIVEWVATMGGSVAWRAKEVDPSPKTVGELVVRDNDGISVLSPVGRGWHDILRDCGRIGYDAATAYWSSAGDEAYQKLRGLLLDTPAPFQSALWTTATRLYKIGWQYRSVITEKDYRSPSGAVYAGAALNLAADLHNAPQNAVFDDPTAVRMVDRYESLSELFRRFVPRPVLTMAKTVDAAIPTTVRTVMDTEEQIKTVRPPFVDKSVTLE